MTKLYIYLYPLLTLLVPTLAAPSKALEPRGASQCGQYTSISTGTFTIASNEWGASYGSGSQCSQINSLSGSSLAWQTTWTWANNPNNVKSYTNVESSTTSCKQLSAYKTIPTTWSWSYSGSAVRANVAYDTFVGTSCTGAQAYEVMVWLGDFGGVSPLSNNGYPPTPTATPTIGNTAFNLIVGTNGATTVYSFVAQKNATTYSGDLLAFYKYLETNEGLPSSDYLQTIQAGSEVFTGSGAELLTTAYTISSS
ncbi:hypothetical protein OEA41_005920 [Lepraria neglecta]|uniref:Uncharacterized protein n=1 Tax=Lepraria neglecta TaxID=209136 RepID=A0AAD9Z7X8_9LECA|nr:hypothetical protein OEA41_005920 [Lepraria neglecta]